MGGVSGAFFEPLALAYVLAVVASMLVALTMTPALSLMFLGSTRPRHARVAGRGRAQPALRGRLRRLIGERRRNVFIAAAVVVAARPLPRAVPRPVAAAGVEGARAAGELGTAPGTSYTETYRITSRVSRELRALPGVRNVGAHVGRAVTGDQIVGINSSQIWVSIDPKADYDEPRSRRSAKRSTATPASIATCRPICATRSAKC